MGIFPIKPEKEKALNDRMAAAGLRESDMVEKFIGSGGKGGQKSWRHHPGDRRGIHRRDERGDGRP